VSSIHASTPGEQLIKIICVIDFKPSDGRSSSGKTSPVSGSLRFEEYPELPSSPSSLLSSRWSYPNPLEASEALAHHSPLGTSDILSEAPIVASSSTLASALSPQDEIIPFQFSDSIFEEKLSDDGAEADTIWDAVSDNGTSLVRTSSTMFKLFSLLFQFGQVSDRYLDIYLTLDD